MSALSLANLIAYIFNLIVTYTVGNTNIAGKSNAEVSAEYPTLFTPAGWAFAIWGFIFILEGCFAVYQFLPKNRDSPLIEQGVGIYWIVMVLVQAGWSLSFAYEKISLSMAFIIGIFLSLQAIVYNLSKVFKHSPSTTFKDYVFIFLPFSINWAWITAATIVNANLLAVYRDPSNLSTQVTVAVISFVLFGVAAVMGGFTLQDPAYCIVLVWAGIAIALQLKSPPSEISSRFPSWLTNGLSQAAFVLVGLAALAAVGSYFTKAFKARKSSTTDSSSTDDQAAAQALLRH